MDKGRVKSVKGKGKKIAGNPGQGLTAAQVLLL